MELEFERCYRAVASRDRRFDGWFFTAVTSTGIYCRPSCPARTPRPENVRFFATAAAAQRRGFRACARCRPETTPGSPEWDTRADVTARAMRLIGDGVVDREGVPGLARRLGYTERHLHRLLTRELGVGPLALARAQRAQTARTLIETTKLTAGEIAFAAGFGSVRQFNDTLSQVYGRGPTELRLATARRGRTPPDRAPLDHQAPVGAITVRLPYREPLPVGTLFEFLRARAVPGLEAVTPPDAADGAAYHRALALPHGAGTVTLRPGDGGAAPYVSGTLRLADLRDLAPAVARCRRLLDLDADPIAVDDVLAADPALAPAVRAEPGIRVPRTVDGFEMAVRAVVGQQISVAAARRVLTHLISHTAAPPEAAIDPARAVPADRLDGVDLAALRPFPAPETVLGLPDDAFRVPAARRATLRALAEAIAEGRVDLDGGGDPEATRAAMAAIPGIGPWTIGYLALRALCDPDTMLATDVGVLRGARTLGLPTAAGALAAHAERWRPWRSYATIRFWRIG